MTPRWSDLAVVHVDADRVGNVDRFGRSQVDIERRAAVGRAAAGIQIGSVLPRDAGAAGLHHEGDGAGRDAGTTCAISEASAVGTLNVSLPLPRLLIFSATPPWPLAAAVVGQKHAGRRRQQNRILVQFAQRHMNQAGLGEAPGLAGVGEHHHFGDDALRQLDAQRGHQVVGVAIPAASTPAAESPAWMSGAELNALYRVVAVGREDAAAHVLHGVELAVVVELNGNGRLLAFCCAITPSVAVSYSVKPAMNRDPSGAIERIVDCPVTVRLRRMDAEAVSINEQHRVRRCC